MLIDLHAHSSGISKCCRITFEEVLNQAIAVGIDGVVINCHPLYKKYYATELMDIAQRNNLFLTCGGDYHADTYRPKCGMLVSDDMESSIGLGLFLSSNGEKKICMQEPDSTEITWLTVSN